MAGWCGQPFLANYSPAGTFHIYAGSALEADADASKADTESESGGGIFTTRVQSPQSHKYPSTLPLSTPAPNEPELTALMQLVARRKLQLCNRDALNSGL